MNWVKKKTLSAIKSITFKGQPCNSLPSLWNALHSSYNSAENHTINTRFLSKVPQCKAFEWPSFSRQKFKDTIAKCSSFSTPGPDHVSWRHLRPIINNDKCLKKIVCIANACIILEYWPSQFKEAKSVVIPKPNKDSYNTPKAFYPIVLLNTMGKLIEKVISNCLQSHMAWNGFLNPNQLGGIRQCLTTSIGIYFTHLIQMG